MRELKYILDEKHNPLPCPDVIKWSEWMENFTHKRIAFTQIDENVVVSTVFLGIDHNLGDRTKPLLWETMSFGLSEKDMIQMRYTSHIDALIGHERAVLTVKSILQNHIHGKAATT